MILYSISQFEMSELPQNTGSAATPLAGPQTGTAGRDILEDINTFSSPQRRNACSCQVKKAPNARPGAGKRE